MCCSQRLAAARPTAADGCIREAFVVAGVARCGGGLVHVWRLPTPVKLTTSVRGHICLQGAPGAALHTRARATACTYLGTSTKAPNGTLTQESIQWSLTQTSSSYRARVYTAQDYTHGATSSAFTTWARAAKAPSCSSPRHPPPPIAVAPL